MGLGVIILAALASRLRVSYRTPLTGCARENGTGGASGVFRWADRIGIPVQLLEVPIWEASQALRAATGNCILTMGSESWSLTTRDAESENWHSTRDWLSRGNTLIVVTAAAPGVPAALRRALLPSNLIATGTARSVFRGWETVDNRPETSQAPLSGGGILTVNAKGPRGSVSSAQKPAAAASAMSPSPSVPDAQAAQWQLAADERGGVLYRIPAERGVLYVLLDDFAWTNAGFDHGDNARVLAELLLREIQPGGVLALDEYRHGHGRTESFLTYLLALPGSSAVVGLGALWALLYFYGRNARLSPAEEFVQRERRTAQEYIDAVAQLYERARAAPLVVEAVARRLRQLARSSAAHPPAVDSLLQSAEHYLKEKDRPTTPNRAIQLVTELIQLRKRFYGSRTVS
jgi:hypothetical protein